jgi:hypothetical protein
MGLGPLGCNMCRVIPKVQRVPEIGVIWGTDLAPKVRAKGGYLEDSTPCFEGEGVTWCNAY